MLWLQIRFDGMGEPQDIGIIANQLDLLSFTDDFDDIHSSDTLGCRRIKAIKIWDHLLLIRDGDIHATQVGIAVNDALEGSDVFNLKINVLCIDIL